MESHRISVDLSQSNSVDQMNNGSPTNRSVMPPVCALCRMMPSTDGYMSDEPGGICGHCKFLLLEDLDTPSDGIHLRRLRGRGRRLTRSSSESTGDFFSEQFSQMMSLARHNQPLVSEHHDPPGESDSIPVLLEQTSSHSTPDSFRRWRRMSDTESDGFGNSDSLYWESESIDSFDARIFHGDSDTRSVSIYGGESVVSMEDHSFLETETFVHNFERGDTINNSDIDPMHVGPITWNLDDHDGTEEGYGSEDEEADIEILRARFLSENGVGNRNRLRFMERRYNLISSILLNLDESGDVNEHGNPTDHENIGGFEESAPPAAESFVNSLPRLVISENQEKSDEPACAICKDMLLFGNEAIRLPCLHLYHSFCILPWLGRRNSCPLCRYELPRDDLGHEVQRQDNSSDTSDPVETVEAETVIQQEVGNLNEAQGDVERGRRCWIAVAPVISILGIVFLLWRGKPLTVTQSEFHDSPESFSCTENQQERRGWWRWF